uniref:UBX domain-containing protein 11 n=1 Tax=Sus scrofa TaxID=9823 RepID=A0A8D0XB86_PIG
MSSPLASLGKTRRVPLQSEPVNPGRRGIKIYGNVPVSHDSELVATMMKKLRDLEQQVKAQADEMLFKDRKIRALEELVETLQEHQGSVTLRRQEELEATCTQLQRQVGEMERFLGDYGLQWVGEPVDQEDSEDNERDWMTAKKFWKPGDSLVPPEVDFDRLLASLKDLSELVVDSDTQVTPVPSRVPHHALEPIPLKLYRNGIMMFDGPFRPFYAPSTQRCLRDILDGFFPSELQRLYPDGVPFKVMGCSSNHSLLVWGFWRGWRCFLRHHPVWDGKPLPHLRGSQSDDLQEEDEPETRLGREWGGCGGHSCYISSGGDTRLSSRQRPLLVS